MTEPTSHPGSDEIAAYAEGRLPSAERAAIEAHFAGCGECRREATEVGLFLKERVRQRTWVIAVPAVVAAAAAAFLLLAWPMDERAPSGGALRSDAPGEALPRIEVVEPAGERPVHPDSVRFAWRGVAPDAFYRLSVTDSEGTVVWEGTVSDTVAVLPPGTALEPGGRYFWYVDALGRDGNVASSGVRELRTRER